MFNSSFKGCLQRWRKRISTESYRVRVVPSEGAWKVASDQGCTSMPWPKAETIKCARDLARSLGLNRIAVCDNDGSVTAVVSVGPF